VGTDDVDHYVPGGFGAAGQDQVDLMAVEQGTDAVAVAGLQADAGLGVAPAEAAQDAGHDLLGRGGDGGDPQLAPLGVGRGHRRPARLVEQAQDPARVPGVGGAGVGQPQPAPIGGDQGDPERLLQGGDRGGHRGLGDHQILRRGAHRAALGHGQEAAELVEGHRRLTGRKSYEKSNSHG
jgi:hypothetical protein